MMHGMEVILPGGLPKNGSLERRARFRPLTGRMEQTLIELKLDLDRPGYVTAVLASALDSIGNQSVNAEMAAELCVADRQFLMLRLASLLDGEQMWLNVYCGHCSAPFDVDIQRCDLPVKQAGQDYPRLTLRMGRRTMEVRVPTGADQKGIAAKSDGEAMQQILRSCILAVNGMPPGRELIDALTEPEIQAIDNALDAASPAVCNRLRVTCPECGREQYAELDHYDLAGVNRHSFYDEVHTLASHYHWSEAEILDLPQARRRLYLNLINRSAGFVGQEQMP